MGGHREFRSEMASAAYAFCGALLVCLVVASAYTFEESFSDSKADLDAWVSSEKLGGDQGKMIIAAGKYGMDPKFDLGLKTTQDSKHYAYSRKIPEFDTTEKPLVVQFSVRHEQLLDCGGGYIKLMAADHDPKTFGTDSPFAIMFGPDICGAPTRQTRVVLTYKGKVAHVKRLIRCETDEISHLYTLVLARRKGQWTYDVLIDNKKIDGGVVLDDFDLLEPKQIEQSGATKPADWDDRARIADPEHTKPADWDDHKPIIADPNVKKPETWDEEMDGEWSAPLISNPEFVGEWKQRTIPNPSYKGNWSAPMIPNPAFVDDPTAHFYKLAWVGFELWQVKSGSYFDNILITDDIIKSRQVAEEILGYFFREKDIKAKADEQERNRKEAERKAVEWGEKKQFQKEADAIEEEGHADL